METFFLLRRERGSRSGYDILAKRKVSLKVDCSLKIPSGFHGQLEGFLWKEGIKSIRSNESTIAVHSEYKGFEFIVWTPSRGSINP